MLGKLKTIVKHIPGWRTNQKILVIESDDWGSIRMPNAKVREELLEANYDLDNNFLKYDTLTNKEDINLLFEVLSSVKDSQGNFVKFTPFVNLTNPDFKKIINHDYKNYYFEMFVETQKKYYGRDFLNSWLAGINNKIFYPEYHGREHFNVPLLMNLLQNSEDLKFAFKKGVVHIPLKDIKPKKLKTLAPAYYVNRKEEFDYYKNSLREGISIFKHLFKYQPKVFAAPNGIFMQEFEEELSSLGLNNFVVNRKRVQPDLKGGFTTKSFNLSFGKTSKNGHMYYRRNVKFEPVQSSYNQSKTINEINIAFAMGKPAILSTHKVNYVGSLSKKHRDKNLLELKTILRKVVNKHPDIIFMSSRELCKLIRMK
ncbi:hypothetical protein [Psychroflexus sp. ALD_RP9]|uniref:hypothetical protein n=1 Tax=Psychroflexus sp. ALD_RP9 TaxID=2777186 RepID=UPI001A900D10|nr:hypothetical protein [Psychroflexus sp. ALD_RP9]QSS98024.1 hypothetical protein IMZ30_04735 [Psychroflexus sp. ALD_RP9]